MTTTHPLARRIARRFVAGETIEDALAVTRELHRRGAGAEIDYLGENVHSPEQATASASAYLELIDRLTTVGTEAHVSLKPTQMGLAIDPELCFRNVTEVVERAAAPETLVWLDMEASEYTDRTLDLYRRVRADHENVGVAIQAYLHRSKADVQALLSVGGTVRLCKGAYMEPASVAIQDKTGVDNNFMVLADMLLSSRRYQAIATHDEKMIRHVVKFARANGIDSAAYEFHLLYGVRRDLQLRLLREGYRVRIYVPFGQEWYPYFMRRLAERPANLVFLVSSLAREAKAA